MKIKMVLTAAALVVSPVLAAAECSWGSEHAMTCAEGSKYDTATNSCVVMSS